MNFTFTNLTSYTNINQNFYIENILKDICNQWSGWTLNSHLLYAKIILIWLFIHLILEFWNPFINVHTPKFEFIIFKKKIFEICFLDREEYLSDIINQIFYFFLICMIVRSIVFEYFVIEKLNLIEFILKVMKNG